MQKFLFGAALVAVAVVAPAQAQESVITGKPSVFHVEPYVGYVWFGDHFETGNNVEFSNKNTGLFGVQAGLDVSRYAAIVGNFGYSKTQYSFENLGGTDRDVIGSDVGIWLYDANLHLKMPSTMGSTTFAPFAQAGVGAIKFSTEDTDFRSKGSTNVAYNVGLGADMQVFGIGFRGMVKDYISSFQWDDFQTANDANDIKDASISHNWVASLGFKISF